MKIIELPKWLEPAGEYDLIRLGRDRDGGYLVDSRDVLTTDSLVSLGICDDWSFDRDFLEHRDVPLLAFDGTVSRSALAKRAIKAAAHRNDVVHAFKAWRDYRSFFSGSRSHVAMMVGLGRTPGFVTLQEILNTYTPRGNVFLKIDIEGWEYRILDDALAQADRICGLVAEFHDIDLHCDRLEEFVENLPLRVAHVHYNSFAPISDDGLPLVIEVTFSSHEPISLDAVDLPHRLDRLSDPHHDPRKIRFAS